MKIITRVEHSALPPSEQYKYCIWDKDHLVLYADILSLKEEAKELVKEAGAYGIATTRTCNGYDGDTYECVEVNYFNLAKLIHHIRTKEGLGAVSSRRKPPRSR